MSINSTYSEKDLVAGIKSGDDIIMEHVYRQYFPMVAQFVRNNQGNDADAEDLYQEGLLAVFRKIREGEDIQYLKTYVYAVCRNQWLGVLRYRKRHPESISDDFQLMDARLDDEERDSEPYHKTLQKALAELDEVCRSLLLAFYFEKLSMDAIARRFHYKQANTAKSKKNKCMERVRQKAKTILKHFSEHGGRI